jgi:hypothetical protein
VTVSPIFFPTVPDKNPRRECGCQLVALSSPLAVTPPGRFSSSRIVAVLLPSRTSFRALRGAFFFGAAFFPALALAGVTLARRAPVAGFFVALGSLVAAAGAVCVCSVVDFHTFSLAVDYRVTTSITQEASESKQNQYWRATGDAIPVIARWGQMGADGGWARH